MFISVSSPDDTKVIATPPWWTPDRLAATICILLLLLVAITAWQVSLRKLSEQRGRELYRNQIADDDVHTTASPGAAISDTRTWQYDCNRLSREKGPFQAQ